MESKFLELFKNTVEIEGKDLQLADKFREYEEWDSLALLSVIAMIDEEYGVLIEGNAFQKLITLQDLFDEIQKRKAV